MCYHFINHTRAFIPSVVPFGNLFEHSRSMIAGIQHSYSNHTDCRIGMLTRYKMINVSLIPSIMRINIQKTIA